MSIRLKEFLRGAYLIFRVEGVKSVTSCYKYFTMRFFFLTKSFK